MFRASNGGNISMAKRFPGLDIARKGYNLTKHQKIGPVKNLLKSPTSPAPNINPVRNFSRNFNPVRALNTLHPNINP